MELEIYQKVLLVITDGIGHNPNAFGNAVALAKTPCYDQLFATMPHCLLKTSGAAVGLPEGQMGNSEVGHLTLGTGRILDQDLVRINTAIADDSLANNKNLVDFVKKHQNIHLLGLMSDGGVHSHLNHLIYLAKAISKQQNAAKQKIYLHLFTDGRDVKQKSALSYLSQIQAILNENIQLASLSGRFYAMDRDSRFERLERAFRAINGNLKPLNNAQNYINSQYERGIFDEFIEPACFSDFHIAAKDGLVMTNFRADRVRQLLNVFSKSNCLPFSNINKNANILCMCEYDQDYHFPVLFKQHNIKESLAEMISKAGLSQLHTAETEKYAHVSFFFNGGLETPFVNESRLLVNSPKVKTYDLAPKMSAAKVLDATTMAMRHNYDFVLVNFANGDMVGHTGDLAASIQAVQTVDQCLAKLLQVADQQDYSVIITSDHGNCEALIDSDHHIITSHTLFDVFCFIKAKGLKSLSKQRQGLCNVAATVLKIMGLEHSNLMQKALF